jgi:thioredoxin-dependent peroxiredoxin
MLPDGSAAFTKALGMAYRWDEAAGFGLRSWRYSAVFNNMKIEKIFVEVRFLYTVLVPMSFSIDVMVYFT